MEGSVSSSDHKRITMEQKDLLAEIVRSDFADGVFGFCEDSSATARQLCLCSTALRDAVEFRYERSLRTIYQAHRNRMDATSERRVRDQSRLDTTLTHRRKPVPLPYRYRVVAATSCHLYLLQNAAQHLIPMLTAEHSPALSPSRPCLLPKIFSWLRTSVIISLRLRESGMWRRNSALRQIFMEGSPWPFFLWETVSHFVPSKGSRSGRKTLERCCAKPTYTGQVDSAVSLGDGKTVLCGALSGKIFLINICSDEDNNEEPLELSPTGNGEFTGSYVVAACRRKWAIVRKSSITTWFDENGNLQFKNNISLAVHDLEKNLTQQHALKVERAFPIFFPLPNDPHKFLAHGNEWVLFELSEEGILSQKPSFRSSCGVMLTGARPLLFSVGDDDDHDDGGSLEIRCAETNTLHRSLRLPPGHKPLLPSDSQIVTTGKELLVGLTDGSFRPASLAAYVDLSKYII